MADFFSTILSTSGGRIGEQQTMNYQVKLQGSTHTTTWNCGWAVGTVCYNTSDTVVYWTPPMHIAEVNTTGETVQIKFTTTTYVNGQQAADIHEIVVPYEMPNIAPKISFSSNDNTGNLQKFGAFVQNVSNVVVNVSYELQYNASLAEIAITLGDKTITGTTEAVFEMIGSNIATTADSFSLKLTVKVTDSRGASNSLSKNLQVLTYSKPNVHNLAVTRSNYDGTSNSDGGYLCVKFSANIARLSAKNTAAYSIQYKKKSESDYTLIELSDLDGVYSVTDSTYVFAADTDKAYDVVVTATDIFFSSGRMANGASTLARLFSVRENNTGFALGKTAELEGVFDIGFKTKFTGGIMFEELAGNTNLDYVSLPGFYCNLSDSYFLIVAPYSSGEGNIMQIKFFVEDTNAGTVIQMRVSSGSAWHNWRTV